MTTWYFSYQAVPESEWITRLASEREKIVRDRLPPFTTILDVDTPIERDTPADVVMQAHYRGPFYIDLDSDDLNEVIPQYQKLLRKLVNDCEIDLTQVELSATGGRGFHILIPQAIFMSKVPPRGALGLPLIYKEMANALFVDTLDLNIYSMKRGRMFRTLNVQRTNERYKVPITVQESFDMTPELYIQLTSAPRHVPPPRPPEYSSDLALLFATSSEKMTEAIKARKNAKVDESLLKQFGDTTPPTLAAVMAGESLGEGVGFQKIATQLAITAHALKWPLDVFLTNCNGLIRNHVGDGARYGSPAKRKAELQRMYHYMDGNPVYSFSVGGIKSLLDKSVKSPDLDFGVAEVSAEVADDEVQFSVSQGIRVRVDGIFKKTEDGLVKVSAMGLSNPKQLLDLESQEVHGYEVDVHIDGRLLKPKTIGMDAFTSRSSFLKFTLSAGSCNIGLTDAQIGALADIMRVRTEKNGQKVFTIRREGLDVIHTPEGDIDIVWADQYGVSSKLNRHYRLTGSMTEDPQYRTDLRQAPMLLDTDDSQKFFDNMFNINQPETVGRLFGFYLAAFISQPIRHLFGKFPFLQVYGPAGSGKSDTNHLFAYMHYHLKEPVVSSALDATKFTYEEMITCSGSIPFILDEFKPREMRKDLLEKAKGLMRSNYNGDTIGKGAVDTSTGKSKLTLTRVSNRAPMVVIGEAIISQTAILDRSIVTPVTKEGKQGRRDAFVYCQEHRTVLSNLGRICIEKAKAINLTALRASVHENINLVRNMIGNSADDNDRPIYNIAILLTGLEFGRLIMQEVYGDRYNDNFEALRRSVTISVEALIPKVVSEAAKILDTIAYLSRFQTDERFDVKSGEDYVDGGDWVELRLKNCYAKQARFKRSTGDEMMYDSYEAFYSAMASYHGTIDTRCNDSALKDSPSTAVFRFSKMYLAHDGVEEFKTSN